MSNLHIASMTLIKLSILIFYRRVFPFGGFRKACVFVGCFVAASGIGIIIANICHCEHVSDTITLPQNRKGQCIDTNPLYQSAAVILTIGDAFVLLLPFPEIFKSSMALNRKLHVIGVLLVGSLYVFRPGFQFFPLLTVNKVLPFPVLCVHTIPLMPPSLGPQTQRVSLSVTVN